MDPGEHWRTFEAKYGAIVILVVMSFPDSTRSRESLARFRGRDQKETRFARNRITDKKAALLRSA